MQKNIGILKKGFRTSELWIVLLVMLQQYFKSRGVDLPDIQDVTTGVLTAQEQVIQLANELHTKYSTKDNTTVWLAIAYVLGRKILKWRELGVMSTATVTDNS